MGKIGRGADRMVERSVRLKQESLHLRTRKLPALVNLVDGSAIEID